MQECVQLERGDCVKRILSYIYGLAGLGCFAYWLLIGLTARFGLDMHWMWLAAGGAMTAAGLLCRRNLPRWIRMAWRGLLCAGLVMVLALECLVISGMNAAPPAGVDYLIVLGAKVEADGSPSKALQRRINAAAEYLEQNPQTIVIASGGQGADEPMSEAVCIRNGLAAKAIDENRVLLEDQSTTTAENMEFSKAMMRQTAQVGIVTNNYHIYRAVLLVKHAGIENVHGLAAEYTGFTLLHYMMRDGACLIADKLLGNL